MSPSARVLIALLAGLAGGVLLAVLDKPAVTAAAAWLDPIGQLWLNALRMTVVPLVLCLLITGLASATDAAASGRTAAYSMVVFAVFLAFAALLAALLVPMVLARWPVDAAAGAALRAGASQAQALVAVPRPLRDWIIEIIPSNPFEAVATAAMLPMIVFALFFGLALTRIAAPARAVLLDFFQAVVDTMLVIVHWVLWAAPLGVFVLALGVGRHGGIAGAGAIGYYLAMMCAISILLTVILYPVTHFAGIRIGRFALAAVPVQIVALSTQSSLASLPAMIDAAETQLGIARPVIAVTLPMSVSLFRITSPAVNLAIVVFAAQVYGVSLDAGHLMAGAAVAFITNFAVVGLPSQITFFNSTVPISIAMGVPTGILPLFLAVEIIPDLFRTVGNVTGDLCATAVVSRLLRR
jgi:proton glutamate symport protein